MKLSRHRSNSAAARPWFNAGLNSLSRGEIAYYAVSNGTSKPYRLHMRTPSFGNLMALPTLLEGTLIADSIASLGSMDFVLGDTDR